MHVVVAKKDLLRVLARCQGVADKKSTMPVLGNVLLEVSGTDQLRLAATDLYLAVSGKIPAKVESGGAIAIGARDLFERVKMMPDGQISIVTSGGAATTIRAVGASRRFTLHGIPGDEFPSLPQPDEAAAPLTIPIATVSSLIAGTYAPPCPMTVIRSAFEMATVARSMASKSRAPSVVCNASI